MSLRRTQGTFHLPSWYKYAGKRKMSIAEKLLAIVLCRPRLRVEDTIRKLGSLVSMGMGGKGNIQTSWGLDTVSKWTLISRNLKHQHQLHTHSQSEEHVMSRNKWESQPMSISQCTHPAPLIPIISLTFKCVIRMNILSNWLNRNIFFQLGEYLSPHPTTQIGNWKQLAFWGTWLVPPSEM